MKNVCFALVLLVLIQSVHPWAVNFFTGSGKTGIGIGVAGQEEECVNIPAFFHAKAVDVRDFCVNLYTERECKGTKYSFFKSSSFNLDLTKVTDKRFYSVRSCNTDY